MNFQLKGTAVLSVIAVEIAGNDKKNAMLRKSGWILQDSAPINK